MTSWKLNIQELQRLTQLSVACITKQARKRTPSLQKICLSTHEHNLIASPLWSNAHSGKILTTRKRIHESKPPLTRGPLTAIPRAPLHLKIPSKSC